MKKLISLTLMATLLTGCSSPASYISSLSDGSTALITLDGEAITKDDVYHYYLDNYGSSQVLSSALEYIASQEITDQDKIDSTLQETVDTYTQYAGTDLDSYAVQLGYESGEQYKEEALLPSVMQQLLLEKYIDENFDSLRTDYQVKYLKTITFNTEVEAETFIADTAAEDFDAALESNEGEDVGMVTNADTTVDANIIAVLDKFTEDGIYEEPINLTDESIVVVYVYNSEPDETAMQEIKDKLETVTGISLTVQNHYLDAYGFTVNEPLIEQAILDTLSTD